MKKIALTLTALLAAASTFGQGVLNFSTFVPGSIDAVVTYEATGERVGDMFWGQLLAGPTGGDLQPIGEPVEFRTQPASALGYIVAGTVAVPDVAAGSDAQVQLVAWHKDLGDSWEEAQAAGLGGIGQSDAIEISLGGGNPPLPPTNLAGLEGFEVSTLIPEPTVAALGLLGAGLLLFRRKK